MHLYCITPLNLVSAVSSISFSKSAAEVCQRPPVCFSKKKGKKKKKMGLRFFGNGAASWGTSPWPEVLLFAQRKSYNFKPAGQRSSVWERPEVAGLSEDLG